MTSESIAPNASIRVTTHEESPVALSLAVEVDAKRVDKAFERAYRDLGRNVKVKGFRPGKVPRGVLEKLYAPQIAEQIEQTLVSETIGEAIEQSGIEPVTEPAIEAGSRAVVQTDFNYTVRLEIKPKFELPSLDGLPAVQPVVDVSESEVDEQLEELRTRNAPAVEEPDGTAIETGHVASIDFVGRVDGEAFEGGSGQGVELEIGSGSFIPGFEEQLVGAASGDDVEVNVTFPEEYGNAELAGKEAVFACHVAAVKRKQLPELDDDFAKDMGDFETLDALKERIRGDMVVEQERESKRVLRKSLLDALVDRTDFAVPPGMVDRQLEHQLQAAHQRMQGQIPHEAMHRQMEQWREEWRGQSEREVREILLMEAVVADQKIEVSDEEVDAKIAEMAEQQGVPADVLERAHGDEQLKRGLRGQLLDERALAFLEGKAKVAETTEA
jgi:trigger factor